MKIIGCEKYSFSTSGSQDLILNGNKNGDTVVGEIYLQVLDALTVAVTGYVDSTEDAVTLKTIDMANYQVKDSITAAGIYMIPSGAYQKINLAVTGTGDILVKQLY